MSEQKHDQIPPEHLATRTPKVCPVCFHNWLAPKTEPDEPCPMCKVNPSTSPIWSSSDVCPGRDTLKLNPVLQPWVMALTWKMQSILFSSLRGPDQELLMNIKQVSKWMRSVTQQNADPSKPYMNNIELPLVSALYKELEHCPCHFVHHFLDGLAIIAYHHPDEAVAGFAARVHYHCAEEIFHFYPEPPGWFKIRHRDKVGGVDEQKEGWKHFEDIQKREYMEAALRRFAPPHNESSLSGQSKASAD